MRWVYGVGVALCCLLLCACSVEPGRSNVLDIEVVEDAGEDRGTPVPTLRVNSSGAKPAAAAPGPTTSPVALQTQSPVKLVEDASGEPEDTPSPTPVETHDQTKAVTEATTEAKTEAILEPELVEESQEKEGLLSLQAVENSNTASMLNATAMEYVFQALARAGVNAETENFHVRITCSTASLFSCVAEVEKKPGKSGYTLYPVTVDMHSGKVLSLSNFFSSTDREWRSVLPDIVTDIADEKGMTLLCEVPPISDDQPFYIDKEDIVLVYRPYEITTYDAGEPCFELPMREIASYTTGAYGIGG